jgi:hypothetical protein
MPETRIEIWFNESMACKITSASRNRLETLMDACTNGEDLGNKPVLSLSFASMNVTSFFLG